MWRCHNIHAMPFGLSYSGTCNVTSKEALSFYFLVATCSCAICEMLVVMGSVHEQLWDVTHSSYELTHEI